MQVENDITSDHCPLCGCGQIAKLGPADYSGQLVYSSRQIELAHRPEVWACRDCGSGFTQHVVPEAISRQLYTSSEAEQRWSTAAFEETKTQEVLGAVGDIFRHQGRLLDIGCNTGELLDYASKHGCETSGLEYSAASRDTIAAKGHRAFSSFDEISERFDVITAFDLIEHLYDVGGFLKSCHSCLSDEGRLIILTGDIQSPGARAAGAHWWYLQYPEHIVFPSKKFFDSLGYFKLETWLPTFASLGYRFSIMRVLLSQLKTRLSGRQYTGLPSRYPDHALVVLRKS